MLTVQVAGTAGNVPGDAIAALVSVTAVEPCADTFLTVFPCGAPLPTASMVNAEAFSIVANSAVVRLGVEARCASIRCSQPMCSSMSADGSRRAVCGPDRSHPCGWSTHDLANTRPCLLPSVVSRPATC